MNLDDLRRECQALIEAGERATKGPWRSEGREVYQSYENDRLLTCDGGYSTSGGSNQEDDSRFIAAARNSAPQIAKALLAALGCVGWIRANLPEMECDSVDSTSRNLPSGAEGCGG